MDATPQVAVAVFANLDAIGQVPTEGHHVEHRSTAPALRKDLRNYRGTSTALHVAHHRDGVPLPDAPTLALIWNG